MRSESRRWAGGSGTLDVNVISQVNVLVTNNRFAVVWEREKMRLSSARSMTRRVPPAAGARPKIAVCCPLPYIANIKSLQHQELKTSTRLASHTVHNSLSQEKTRPMFDRRRSQHKYTSTYHRHTPYSSQTCTRSPDGDS